MRSFFMLSLLLSLTGSTHAFAEAIQPKHPKLIFMDKTYSAIIFDCDGVLVDTEGLKQRAWQQAFKKLGISLSESDYLPLVGYSSEKIAQSIATQKHLSFDQKALITEKEAIYHQLQKQGIIPLKEGIFFLKKVISQKKMLPIKVALASSASREEILENLKQIQVLPTDFDVIISGKDDLLFIPDPTGVNKPKPYIYQRCAQLLHLLPKDCLVIEDSGPGVAAAVGAGMDVFAIPNRFTQHHDFSKATKIGLFDQISVE